MVAVEKLQCVPVNCPPCNFSRATMNYPNAVFCVFRLVIFFISDTNLKWKLKKNNLYKIAYGINKKDDRQKKSKSYNSPTQHRNI